MRNLIQSLKLQSVATLSVALFMLSGCAVGMKIPVKDPVPSATQFSKSAAATPAWSGQ